MIYNSDINMDLHEVALRDLPEVALRDLPYILLIEIYDLLSMTNKKKLIKSYNEECINEVLKEDMVKRYKLWILKKKPILVMSNPSDMIQLIDTFEELGQ